MSGMDSGCLGNDMDLNFLNMDTFNEDDLYNINIPDNLNLDAPELMTSEFFNTVMSMEESNMVNIDNEWEFSPVSSNTDDQALNSDPEDSRYTLGSPSEEILTDGEHKLPPYLELKDSFILKSDPDEIPDELEEYVKNFEDYKSLDSLMAVIKYNEKGTEKTLNIPLSNDKILKNVVPPNTKKVIVTKPSVRKYKSKQILKVQSLSGKGRSVLLPFNVAKMKNIKIINGKEIRAENLKITKVTAVTNADTNYLDNYDVSSPDTGDDDLDSMDQKIDEQLYPLLMLSEEEKRLLAKEGISLPSHYPLTKYEEKELKRIRRKIRNKISAQDSRKRKKEYVDGLEERIRQNAEEKKMLMSRVKYLQQQNSRLVAHMNKLQTMIFNTSGSKVTPATCLMVVLISALLISLPNLRIPKGSFKTDQQQTVVGRTLLSSQQASQEDSANLEESFLLNKDDESELKNVFDEDNNTEKYRPHIEAYENVYENSMNNFANKDKTKMWLNAGEIEDDVRDTFKKIKTFFQDVDDAFKNEPDIYDSLTFDRNKFEIKNPTKRKYIEPDIDDYLEVDHEVPSKTRKTDDTYQHEETNKRELGILSATVAVNASRKE